MRRSSVFAIACALAFAGAWAYTPVRHDGSYTTNGVTYAQRGGLGSADYVVTNIDADAVGRVKSVNGKTGAVTLSASDVGALPDSEQGLKGNANFSNAVVSVSPPVELPLKWALENVTNASGNAVGASDVGAIPASELVATEFSAASAYEEGDVVRHDGKAYRANTRKAAGLSWQSWMWDEVTNVQTAMEGALRNTYLKLGFAGTNTEEEVRITAGRYEDEIYPLSYFYLSPDSFGNRIGTTGRGWDFADHGYIEWHGGDDTYRRVWFTDIFTPDFVRDLAEPFTLATNKTQFTTSPYYVHRYLTNNHYTASRVDEVVSGKVATATASLVPNTRTVNGKPLSADVSLAASDVGAMAADARIDRLYNGGGSRYISGDGSVYSQNAEERWRVEFNGNTYELSPNFGLAPNYWEGMIDGRLGYLAYGYDYDGYWSLYLGIGGDFSTEGTASDSYLDFQLGTAHFICTRYSTGTTFSYETRLAYTNDVTLTPVRDYEPWTLSPPLDPQYRFSWNGSGWVLDGEWVVQSIPKGDENSTSLSWVGDEAAIPFTATRGIMTVGYTLGSQTNILLATTNATAYVMPQAVTNIVDEVKELHYDEVLNVTWETRIVGGEMKFFAVTNANISVHGN